MKEIRILVKNNIIYKFLNACKLSNRQKFKSDLKNQKRLQKITLPYLVQIEQACLINYTFKSSKKLFNISAILKLCIWLILNETS